MSIWSRLSLAERRMSSMADKNGADLEVASQSGHLLPDEYRAAVQSCSGCACPDACDTFLQGSESGIPGYCRNSTLIRQLADIAPD